MERYLGIVHPFYHRASLTKKLVLTCVLPGVLTVLSILAASFFTRLKRIETAGDVGLKLFLVISTFAYIKIYLVARKVVVSKVQPRNGTTKKEENAFTP